jgi:hypothetical protein
MPNGDAMNSAARGENSDGLEGSSMARSIFGELVKRPSLGVLDGGDAAWEGDESNRSLNGNGRGDTLRGGLRGGFRVSATTTGSDALVDGGEGRAIPPRIWLNFAGVATASPDSFGHRGTGGNCLFNFKIG